jgi:hypothetical protein
MKITATKVKQMLIKEHGWEILKHSNYVYIPIDELMIDIVKIIDSKLKYHKGISIKK